jgi:hypothetical protein
LLDHTSGNANYRIVFDNVELLVQYTVEPDADGDGYGDETQDACPADVATTVACAGAIPVLIITDPASPANENSPKVKGTAFPGSTIALYSTDDCSGTPLASGTAEDLTGAGIPISVTDNSTTHIRATMTLPSGTSDCSSSLDYVEATPSPAPAPSSPAGPGPTGQRDAALQKCKKKHTKKGRKKCRKRARKLPA